MAFTEANRVAIRKYLGSPQIWLQADPRLESAMTNIQSISDGGTRPNPSPSAAEVDALATVVALQNIDTQIINLGTFKGGYSVDEVKVDAAREDTRLRMVGRMLVGRLADSFDYEVTKDCFAVPAVGDGFRSSGVRPGYGGGRNGY